MQNTHKLLRPVEAMARVGLRRTAFRDCYVKTGKLRPIRITQRAVAFLESDVNAVIEELAASSRTPTRPAVTPTVARRRAVSAQ